MPRSKYGNGLVKNFSRHGILISTDRFLPVGTKLQLEFSLPSTSRLVKLQSRVARVKQEKSGYRFTVGSEFVEVNSIERAVLFEYHFRIC